MESGEHIIMVVPIFEKVNLPSSTVKDPITRLQPETPETRPSSEKASDGACSARATAEASHVKLWPARAFPISEPCVAQAESKRAEEARRAKRKALCMRKFL